jgi:ABC-type branched-chain amino acid transport system, permease component
MMRFRNGDLLVTLALLIALPTVLPNAYWFDVTIRMGLAGIAVIGLNILMGFAGQLSIGHAALLAASAYTSAILVARYGLPSALAIVIATAGVTLISYGLARPMLRLRGFALAIGTLGLGIIVQIILVNEVAWTGGPDGMVVAPLQLGPWTISGERQWYVLVAFLLFLAIVSSLNLFGSPAGRALRALNGSEIAAQVAGVDTSIMKIRAFTAAGFFAALAGALTAHYSGFITPDLSAFMRSVEFATMVVVGGRGSTYGVVLGAVLLTILPQALGGTGEYEMIVFGLILMLTVIFLPQGIVPTLVAALRGKGA